MMRFWRKARGGGKERGSQLHRTGYFRPDIEGLRAIAVLSVLLYHTGLPVHGGYVGVDVFFVISGFLITSLLIREAEKTGTISFVHFYARRVKRLLPASCAVLLCAAVFIWRFAPETDVGAFALDLAAAAAYLVNWRFADRSVDYLAEDTGRSPILHFWSLAVEEQFYFIWPLVIYSALKLTRGSGRPRKTGMALPLLAILLPSLLWSIYFTPRSDGEAFFVTTTRLWELSIGAMAAILAPEASKFPARPAVLGSWAGLAMILFSVVAFDTETTWPSYNALLPTLGTALVILGGSTGAGSRVYRLLGLPPLVWIGGLSYSLYLWHWPPLVIGQDWLGLSGPAWGTALIAGGAVLAWLGHRFIEQPVRFARPLVEHPWMALSMGAVLSLGALSAGVAVYAGSSDVGADSQAGGAVRLVVQNRRVLATPPTLGAGTLGSDPVASGRGAPENEYPSIVPAPGRATKDLPRCYAESCQLTAVETTPKWCEIGDLASDKVAIVVGDSKILQYYEALDAAGQALHWKMKTVTKSACPFSEAFKMRNGKPYSECIELNRRLMEAFTRDPPAAVITNQTAPSGVLSGWDGTPEESMEEGLRRRWKALVDLGTNVIVVLDNPHPPIGERVYECMARHRGRARQCAFGRKEGIVRSAAPAQRGAAGDGVHLIDLNDYICPTARCAPVIGDVMVYRQGSHLTNTYARTLAPELTRQLAKYLD